MGSFSYSACCGAGQAAAERPRPTSTAILIRNRLTMVLTHDTSRGGCPTPDSSGSAPGHQSMMRRCQGRRRPGLPKGNRTVRQNPGRKVQALGWLAMMAAGVLALLPTRLAPTARTVAAAPPPVFSRPRWIEVQVDPRPFPRDTHGEQGERLYGW